MKLGENQTPMTMPADGVHGQLCAQLPQHQQKEPPFLIPPNQILVLVQ